MAKHLEPVDVNADFGSQGRLLPRRFVWQGQTFQVESTGRRWEDQDGRHVLVMAGGGQVFELLFNPQEARWYLARIGPPRTVV